jgi:choline dehydrogenase
MRNRADGFPDCAVSKIYGAFEFASYRMDSTSDVTTADYVIVGAGTAGCVLAARLSERSDVRVVLVEAGPADRNPWIGVPFGMQMLITNPSVNWLYESEPVAGLGGRKLFEPRGKVIGGTGAINASLYIRGHRSDYDGWRDAGCTGWGYDDVLPFFKLAEHQERGADQYHGVEGPMWVSDGPGDALSRAFLLGTQELGLPQTSDFNGEHLEGFGRFQTTTKDNRRHSTARAYLDHARSRKNLRIISHAYVSSIKLEDGWAKGIEYEVAGRKHQLMAQKEVIVSAGTFNSPHLLQISGIGDGALLSSIGVEVRHHLPGVGRNLQEHFGTKSIFSVSSSAVSMNRVARNPLRKVAALASYLVSKQGPLAWTNTFVGGFARSSQDLVAPDIQITVNAWSAMGFSRDGIKAHSFPGITLNAYHLTPESRGEVVAVDPNPRRLPAVRLSALDTEYDRHAVRASIRLVRQLMNAPALTALGTVAIEPKMDAVSDEALDQFARDKLISMLHPVGTCKMGTGDNAVVDPKLKVRGVGGLRVVDASVMPTVPRGNTNAGTVMIAEKAAAIIRNDG